MISNDNLPPDDLILPFKLENSGLRGRVVRLGQTLDEILEAHDYPLPVSQLVAEACTLSLCLSSMLKYEGIFTLQAQGKGAIAMVVADVHSPGKLRGCASFDEEQLKTLMKEEVERFSPLNSYMGEGYIAFTVDQGEHAERYQGIVDLSGHSLHDCVHHYFEQSEQIRTLIKLAVGREDKSWRASAVMLQVVPEEGGEEVEVDSEAWTRATTLLNTVTDEELLSSDLSMQELLIRLFHEEGVRVFPTEEVTRHCKCSTEKVENVLKLLSEDDRDYMTRDGAIEMTCEFCSKTFRLDPETMKSLPADQ